MAELDDLQTFDIAGAAVTVWTFKKSTPAGQPPAFSGRWIDVDDALAGALREALIEARAGIAETHPYGLLAQVNEGSVLILGADETHAPAIVAQTDDPTPARKVRQLKEINNSAFYVVKLVGGGRTLHAVRRTDDTWRTRKSLTSLNVFYTNEGLTLEAPVISHPTRLRRSDRTTKASEGAGVQPTPSKGLRTAASLGQLVQLEQRSQPIARKPIWQSVDVQILTFGGEGEIVDSREVQYSDDR